jgi:hypothetical protein
MPLDIQTEIARVRKYYENDERQKGFNLLLLSEYGAGKTPLLKTARRPVWIDSFDPGGTLGLRKEIKRGEIIADVQYEEDDPFAPSAYKLWRSNFKKRYSSGFFDQIGTYCIDSATTFSAAILAYKMDEPEWKGKATPSRAGEVPMHRRDYNPAKVEMQNYLRKILNLPCDFILTGHLRPIEKKVGVRASDGEPIMDVKYRFLAIGQAAQFIPLLFTEAWVVISSEGPSGTKRKLLLDSAGEYLARSRLKADGVLEAKEDPDLRAILKKAGFDYKDKPLFKIQTKGGDEV